MSTKPLSLRRDQVLVTVAAAVWLTGTAFGTGLVGGTQGVNQQGEGLFTDSTTLIAPHGPAFSIWSVIYLGLATYVVWQWLPAAAGSAWARATRLPAAASIALNGLWLLVVFLDLVFVSVLVMIGIVVSLGIVLRRTAGLPREDLASLIIVAGTFGLYLGWICVATCANVASWLVGLGVPADGPGATVTTVVVLAVVVGVAAFLLSRTPHRLFQTAFTAAIVWGVAFVAVGRFVGDQRNDAVGYAALVAALAVVVLWVLAARPGSGAGRRVPATA